MDANTRGPHGYGTKKPSILGTIREGGNGYVARVAKADICCFEFTLEKVDETSRGADIFKTCSVRAAADYFYA